MKQADISEITNFLAKELYIAKGAHNIFGAWEHQLYPNVKAPFLRTVTSILSPLIVELEALRKLENSHAASEDGL